ncbi:MAG: hypothetical protein EZS28_013051 [Streblomastix strix]|uniref:Uncharacterized protein n=1 Tax=Streblomastix strix TaxID=222440 RepID=A0A5J4W9S7_9EUKA|nr:MAG: hypothetical protein EZS28_013051 [Streblomastix strix]
MLLHQLIVELELYELQMTNDTATGENGVATTYARSDHTPHENLSNNVQKKDTGTGTAGSSNTYARSEHQHPLNIDPTTANIPLVNATAAANGTSDYYCRNDPVHLQQLTYTGPLTSTMFIKNGAQATDVLLANGDSKSKSDIVGDGFVAKTGKPLLVVQGYLYYAEYQYSDDEIQPSGTYTNAKIPQRIILNAGTPTSFAAVSCGNIQINPTATSYDDGLRISRSEPDTGNATIQLGCNRTSNYGAIVGQWSMFIPLSSSVNNPQGFAIAVSSQAGDNSRGLQISAYGNTLTFNGRVL